MLRTRIRLRICLRIRLRMSIRTRSSPLPLPLPTRTRPRQNNPSTWRDSQWCLVGSYCTARLRPPYPNELIGRVDASTLQTLQRERDPDLNPRHLAQRLIPVRSPRHAPVAPLPLSLTSHSGYAGTWLAPVGQED